MLMLLSLLHVTFLGQLSHTPDESALPECARNLPVEVRLVAATLPPAQCGIGLSVTAPFELP